MRAASGADWNVLRHLQLWGVTSVLQILPLTLSLGNGRNKRQEVHGVVVPPAPPRLLPVPEGLSLLLPLLFSLNTSLPALSRKATTCLSWEAATCFLAHWFTMRWRYTSVVICQRGNSWPSAAAAASTDVVITLFTPDMIESETKASSSIHFQICIFSSCPQQQPNMINFLKKHFLKVQHYWIFIGSWMPVADW